ncbi:MAG: restriction endonuclease [Bacteroidota bacterium]
MVLIKESKGRREGSGYKRLFGNEDLGHLLSRVQSGVIRAGNELEQLIIDLSDHIDDNLDAFLDHSDIAQGVFLVSKKKLKQSRLKSSCEPDFLILEITPQKKHCYIIELKDGDNFDTKKAQGEKDLLQKFQQEISSKLPYTTSIHICCFNQANKDKIIAGFKYKIKREMAMTGEELCKILSLNHTDIVERRKKDQKNNMVFFIEALLKIDQVRGHIKAQIDKA